jgi:hypothetical protein
MKTSETPEIPSGALDVVEARVSQALLHKSHLLFNQTTQTIFHELLQNCRRAQATFVEIVVLPQGDGSQVTILDNGQGIDSAKKLLHLAESNWEQKVHEKEDTAGMGFFSLICLGNLRVRSKNWKVELSAETFQGKAKAFSWPSPHLQGTEITFTLQDTPKSTLDVLQKCVKFYPIPVRINQEAAKQGDFLEGCHLIHEDQFLRIGYQPEMHFANHDEDKVNFFGLTRPIKNVLPENRLDRCTALRIDLKDNNLLDLTLPSRSEVIYNAKWEALVPVIRKAYYLHLAKTNEEHRLPFQNWTEAKTLGVTLREAQAGLRPITQSSVVSSYEHSPLHELACCNTAGRGMILFETHTNPHGFALCHLSESEILALHLAAYPREDSQPLPIPTPLEADPEMEGYSWYPTMKYSGVDFVLHFKDGKKSTVKPYAEKWPVSAASLATPSTWPEKIFAQIKIEGEKKHLTISQEVELAFCEGQSWSEAEFKSWIPSKNRYRLNKETKKGPNCGFPYGITEMLMALYFGESDSHESDSYETQENEWREEVDKFLTTIFFSKRESALQTLTEKLNEYDIRNSLQTLKIKTFTVTYDPKTSRFVVNLPDRKRKS